MAPACTSASYERSSKDDSPIVRNNQAAAPVAAEAAAALSTHVALTLYACTTTIDNREPNAYVAHMEKAPGTEDKPPNLLQMYADASVAAVAAPARIALAPGVAANVNPPTFTNA